MTRRSTLSPRAQIEEAERRLYEIAETGPLRRRLPELFRTRSPPPSTWRPKPTSATESCRASSTGMTDLDQKMGGLQSSDLIIVAGRPGMGKTALATNIAFNIAKAYEYEVQADGAHERQEWRHRRLLLARNVGRAIGDPYHRRAVGRALLQDPPRRHPRARIPPHLRSRPRDAADPASTSTRPAAFRSRSSSARARRLKRQRGLDVLVVDYLQLLTGSKIARATTACRNSPRSPPASRRWPRS